MSHDLIWFQDVDMYVSHARLLVMNFADCFRFYRDVMALRSAGGMRTTLMPPSPARMGESPCWLSLIAG